jgi:TRAP-type C4-dicarboxylate transport system permease small subunit
MLIKIENSIEKLASFLDKLAGISIVLAMLLVVINILLRVIFKRPILGTYEYTGFITSLIVGFGLSACLVSNSHIAVDFILEKFHIKAQRIIEAVMDIIVFAFMSLFTYKMIEYGIKLVERNELSPTTQTPFYIFVFVIAFCFIVLSLVALFKAIFSLKGVRNK